jgi:hypothetical protein
MRNVATRIFSFLALAALATACGNPAVDPDATFTAKGALLGVDGQPLANAEVRLVKYWSTGQLLQPSAEDLFQDTPPTDDVLGVAVVKTARTDASGAYEVTFKGSEIAAPGGYTTAEGLVEVATTVVVARDPADDTKASGVFTYPYVYQQAGRIWDAGRLNLRAAGASVELDTALTSGLVKFSWKKLERGSTMVRSSYRLSIQGKDEPTARLLILCNEGNETEGGCAQDPADATKLVRFVSAYSLLVFYADRDGEFRAYLESNSPDFRYVSRFAIPARIPDLAGSRDPATLQEVWAVGAGADQRLSGAAVDGNPRTREAVTNQATAIYVKLAPGTVSDAGILNSVVTDAAKGCLVLEFTVTAHSDLAAAKASTMGWEQKGKFCGENGARDEVSAIAGFDTRSTDGVVAAWMRLRAVPDASSLGAMPTFAAVGEVALYKKRAR